MRYALVWRLGLVWGCFSLLTCTPLLPRVGQSRPSPTRETWLACDPADPASISGFVTLGDVVGRDQVPPSSLMSQQPIDALRAHTRLKGEAICVRYADPALLQLPVVWARTAPDESELEHLERYLREGGFVVCPSVHRTLRPALETHSDLVWGDEIWTRDLPAGHPIYAAFHDLSPDVAREDLPEDQMGYSHRLAGLFIRDRLVGIDLSPAASRERRAPTDPIPRRRPQSRHSLGQTIEGLQRYRVGPYVAQQREQLRRLWQQLQVNIAVYALTREGSMVRPALEGEQ